MFLKKICCVFLILAVNLSVKALLEGIEGESCEIKNGTVGVCRLIEKCSYAINLLKNGNRPENCGFQKFTPIVCCVDNISNREGSENDRLTGVISEKKCKEYEKYIEKPILIQPDIPQNESVLLIIGGISTKQKQFPHMSLIGYQVDDSDTKILWGCGGSIISDKYILTAAHCIINRIFPMQIFIFCGKPAFVLYGTVDIKNEAERVIAKILKSIPHPEYKPGINYHDIGLLELDKKIQLNEKSRPACLYRKQKLDIKSAFVAGWGKIGLFGSGSETLQHVELDIYKDEECNKLYNDHRQLPEGIRADLMICAGSIRNVADACKGDSGGPLFIKNETMFNVIGIVSFGKPCGGILGWASVYTLVFPYLKWIEDIVWPDN